MGILGRQADPSNLSRRLHHKISRAGGKAAERVCGRGALGQRLTGGIVEGLSRGGIESTQELAQWPNMGSTFFTAPPTVKTFTLRRTLMPCTNNVVIRNPQDQASSRQLWRIDHEAKRLGHSFNSCNTRLTKGLASAAINMLSSADASAHEFILDLLPTKGIKVNSRRQRKVKRAKNGRPRVLKGRVAPEPIPSVLRHTYDRRGRCTSKTHY